MVALEVAGYPQRWRLRRSYRQHMRDAALGESRRRARTLPSLLTDIPMADWFPDGWVSGDGCTQRPNHTKSSVSSIHGTDGQLAADWAVQRRPKSVLLSKAVYILARLLTALANLQNGQYMVAGIAGRVTATSSINLLLRLDRSLAPMKYLIVRFFGRDRCIRPCAYTRASSTSREKTVRQSVCTHRLV